MLGKLMKIVFVMAIVGCHEAAPADTDTEALTDTEPVVPMLERTDAPLAHGLLAEADDTDTDADEDAETYPEPAGGIGYPDAGRGDGGV
jgi:hypothetical protein